MATATNLRHPAVSSRRNARSYFLYAALLYAVFNIVISPLQYWSDILYGWRFEDGSALLLPFTQGSVFFYSIVLNSDSMFRAIHKVIVMKAERLSPRINLSILANITLIIFTFQDYNDVTKAVLMHRTTAFPVSDQVIFLAAALLVGFFMNQFITEFETGDLA